MDIVQQIKNNWAILAFLSSMILWYGNTNARLSSVEAKQLEQKTAIERLANLEEKISSLDTRIAVIDANVEFIKENMRR